MIRKIYLLVLLAFATALTSYAQWPSHRSVLAEHEWYKIGVTAEGVYALDYATLDSLGIDMASVRPAKIRLFGNPQGVLPESNAESRYDDLSEAAIMVTGAEDGSFDPGDRILFYGQGPVNMVLNPMDSYYSYERNPYTDTVFYFLCVDGDQDGLRIGEQASVNTSESDPVIDIFPDYYYHESEEMSPYASGRTWYGDLFTAQEGYREFHLEVPGLVQERGVRVVSRVLGRCKPSVKYNLWLNEEGVVLHHVIDVYKERLYGREHAINKMAYPTSGDFTLRYEFDPCEGNPMLFIDYFVLNYWRSLRYDGPDFAFRLMPLQFMSSPCRVSVANADAGVTCWDVTDPLHPLWQHTTAQEGALSFGMDTRSERRFHLFEPEGLHSVASFRPIPNQNLHALDDADFLIITHRLFKEQADALAAFHTDQDGMNCAVVDVAEIFNEFGTGAPDPTSLRDFIRMLYLRSEGRLKYVLLVGKGTHDYRGIKGVDNNYVPTYENRFSAFSETESMCTDDYFALMGGNEGEDCSGKVDIGVGRFPITTPEQGEILVEKIRHYADLSASHGPWKNNHLLMADNDSKYYPNYAEELDSILDTTWNGVTSKKLYLDSYPVVSSPSGDRIPMANRILMEYFDKGIGVMSYTGHGGVKSLSSEWVLSLSDIQSMTNYDKLPFIHTATCEFSKFDNPGVVSGGELLMMNPNGGAIAMLTTTRPTIANNNQKMSKSLHRHLYRKLDHQSLRFGDIYRLVKSDPEFYTVVNIVYVLFGDPALRFSYPSRDVVTEAVSGEETLVVTGFVADPDGNVDTQFNGVLDVRLYDQKSKYTTLGLYDVPVHYAYYNDVLFDGKVSVTQGRFEALIPVPAVVNQGQGKARLSYSAFDSIRKVEASGIFDAIQVHAPSTVADHQGPDIHLYWNTPDFESGDVGDSEGVLYADLFDEQGIYHYNVSIGRDIVMNSNLAEFDNLILNDRYEPVLDDYRRGRIVLPVGELDDGTYEFSLKAWDTYGNSSEVEVVLLVEHSALLAEIRSYPNPFTDEVSFSFIDGQLTEEITVTIEIFDALGRRVAQVQEQTSSVAGVVPALRWDGKTSTGAALHQGLYLYKLTVTDPSGKSRIVAHPMVKK